MPLTYYINTERAGSLFIPTMSSTSFPGLQARLVENLVVTQEVVGNVVPCKLELQKKPQCTKQLPQSSPLVLIICSVSFPVFITFRLLIQIKVLNNIVYCHSFFLTILLN